ncbi:MAG: AAA domain-containing protein [Methanobacteriaceae archaeon]
MRKEPAKTINGYVSKINPFEKSIKVKLDKKFNFYKGAFLLVDDESGFVIESHGSTVKIEFKNDPSKFKDTYVNIDTSLMNITLDRLEKAIKRIEEGSLSKQNKKILDLIIGTGKPGYRYEEVNFISKTLNPSQAEAVFRAINAENFHLIIGPPGTGKTYVITEIIRQMVRREEKILVTAWTNIAVDNIIERIPELGDKILRIGPKNKISKLNRKYSLYEKRKIHNDWNEIKRIDDLIGDAFENIKYLKEELKREQAIISGILTKREQHEKTLSNLLKIKYKYSKIAENYGKDLEFDTQDYLKINHQKENLENDADKYYNISKEISKLDKLKLNLPDVNLYYDLESEIQGMYRKLLIKKITSIFNKKSYNQFLEDLNNKKAFFERMQDAYNEYWDFHDSVLEKYNSIYPDGAGNPDADALEIEIKLLKQLDELIPLKNSCKANKINKDKEQIIFEAYKEYLFNLDKKAELLQLEIKDLNAVMHIKINKKEKISGKIKNLMDSIDKYRRDKKNLIKCIDSKIIKNADIIAATVISSANYILDDIQFDCMIMDEASQVASFMSLLPLLKCDKFILVGDDKQLQPIEESGLSKELNLSIFNRLIEKYASTFLDTQYRMNQKISDIASKLFYDGKLKTYDAISDQCLECELEMDILNSNAPLIFIDTANLNYYEEGIGNGCENVKEAQLVAEITENFLRGGISADEIGIITPYNKHKNNIMSMLGNNGVEVDTVYRFQGKEKDVIIMSFCNSKLGKLGSFIKKFIEQPTQVNVAITRAKKKFIMVGNSKTLKQSELLSNVIEMIGESN